MPDIKTKKKTKNAIKKLDKTVIYTQKLKDNIVNIKEKSNINNIEDSSPAEYGGNKITEETNVIFHKGINQFNKYGKKAVKETGQNIQKVSQKMKNIKKKEIGKKSIKTVDRITKGVAQKTPKAIKTAEKTGKIAVKSATKTTKATMQVAKKTFQIAKATTKATIKGIKVGIKATVTTIKALILAMKGLIALLIAGGWVALLIIIVVCLIGLLCSSVFGIFFSSEKTGHSITDTRTMNTVISEINKEFMSKLKDVQNSNSYDDYDIVSNRAEWKDILALYSVKVNNGDNATDVVTLSDEKVEILKSIFWDMNTISTSKESKYVDLVIFNDDGTTTKKTIIQTILNITITSKTANEMAENYNFTLEQKRQLAELLSEDYKNLWSAVIYGTSVGNSDIVAVAFLQLGNVGGQPYWSWYGFDARVEWCATFVSWCANELGYIDSGIVPKFAGCQSQGVSWFKACGLWKDRGFIPKEGDIIFFDWEGDSSADHVGIVEFVLDGKVHTIEGNSSNECKQREYEINSSDILGYGTPMY